ncbi:glycosyltransferase [Candidatus Bathyarchaeota archaeon]|nr:glycosyltransferase [Candidatus Bathyarchaeota archaeon]
MSEDARSHTPLITVGIVVLNREWIISKVLNSVLSQTYPHNRIFLLIVDGKSKDKTVETAQKILEKSDLKGYDIVVKKSNIPEGRNMCIDKMQGEALLFWDSDIIMEPNAIQELVGLMEKQKADIVTGNAISMFVDSVKDVDAKVEETMKQPTLELIEEAPAAGMGHTLISRSVLNSVRFDPDLTICEDYDFSIRAREKKFKIEMTQKIHIVDVNIIKQAHSDIHIDMPLKNAMRGMRKKARAQTLGFRSVLTRREAIRFFMLNKRYVFYLGYVPTAILSGIGVLMSNLLLVVMFPFYLLLFSVWQVRRRGVKAGARAISRSFLVGLPTSLWIGYYFTKYTTRKRQL